MNRRTSEGPGRHRRCSRPSRAADAVLPVAVGGTVATVALLGPMSGSALRDGLLGQRPGTAEHTPGPGEPQRATLLSYPDGDQPGAQASADPGVASEDGGPEAATGGGTAATGREAAGSPGGSTTEPGRGPSGAGSVEAPAPSGEPTSGPTQPAAPSGSIAPTGDPTPTPDPDETDDPDDPGGLPLPLPLTPPLPSVRLSLPDL